ncbi:hypothetical protein SH668x_001927 [Planctomicrobium sp. SH668]|uniref:hypothetical protein n=1 Tax=Planctomicrobium sp. SH668 TaxID=3448126 RepID=UPI003F5BBA4B
MQEVFNATDAVLESPFQIRCLTVQSADHWQLSELVWEGTSAHVGATFFCDYGAPWTNSNLLRIETYQLPAGKSEFDKQLEWYTRDRKSRRIKLADGVLFGEEMLHIEDFGSEWTVDAFALSKGEVIRIYQSKKFAVIFRILARPGSGSSARPATLLNHPLFCRLPEDITFSPDTWQTKAPGLTSTHGANQVVELPLSRADKIELQKCVQAAEKRLGIAPSTPVADRIKLIEKEVERARTDRKLNQESRNELAAELGFALGKCFSDALNWDWNRLESVEHSDNIYICHPDRRIVASPIEWISGLLSSKKQPVNCLLTFNLIEADNLPPTRPGAYLRIG